MSAPAEPGHRLVGDYKPNYLTLRFADGEYLFRMTLPQLAELQEKCPSPYNPAQLGAGLGVIYSRVLNGGYFVQDLHQIIRLALIGGGEGSVDGRAVKVSPITADSLVDRYVKPAPMQEQWSTAMVIATALMQGYSPPPDDDPGEGLGEPQGAIQTDGLISPEP